MSELLRLAAFTLDPAGGNPAGVWIGTALPEAAEMQRIATEVGFSETAFLAPDGTGRPGAHRVRYFSPAAEVAFCGHATIAGGVALAERIDADRFLLTTNDGLVTVDTARGADGNVRATLTSVEPRVRPAEPDLLADAMAVLGWVPEELDPELPPAVGYAGVSHLILAAASYETLRGLSYDFDRLRSVMLAADLTTIQLVWREAPDRFRARDPFPGRQRRRGSGHGRGRGGVRCVSALAGRAGPARPIHDQAGRRDGPPQSPRGRAAGCGRWDPRDRNGRVARSDDRAPLTLRQIPSSSMEAWRSAASR